MLDRVHISYRQNSDETEIPITLQAPQVYVIQHMIYPIILSCSTLVQNRSAHHLQVEFELYQQVLFPTFCSRRLHICRYHLTFLYKWKEYLQLSHQEMSQHQYEMRRKDLREYYSRRGRDSLKNLPIKH